MENITAFFKNWAEMDQAATALREQGAIDIVLAENSDTTNGAESMIPNLTSSTQETGSGFTMQVIVESSRFRQAGDIIARFGGDYT
ncbi:hypothetical protein GC093_16130 [Paenibacillus sp. LMG 31456]|uniref:Uncharacterized protein n=1 Tax=Paenibacillus foliorum TaxID=2654974 RepID=A0A972GPX1_9BACL|nr:hypothetical protein [Paenibacillus foliorum]NOU94736.1 hypothetical protein [Paenibacillus foliorum]